MRIFSILATFVVLLQGFASSLEITPDKYNALINYWKYATSAYIKSSDCLHPNGKYKITTLFANGDAQKERGYILHDGVLKQIVVAFRGTDSARDVIQDTQVTTTSYSVAGINNKTNKPFDIKVPSGVLVHQGFHDLYNEVSEQVLNTVRTRLEITEFSKYSIVTVGHSMGGALASIAAVSLRYHLPDSIITVYTYGQPRTGTQAYADFVNKLQKETPFTSYRVTHVNDVVTLVPVYSPSNKENYRHHGVEYYQSGETNTNKDVEQCEQSGSADMKAGEDLNCQLRNQETVFALKLNEMKDRHSKYLGIDSSVKFCT